MSATTVYDRLNRVVSQTTGSPRLIYYDPAGNVDSLMTPNGSVVRQRHDALGRVSQRIVPAMNYAQEGCIGLILWPFNGHPCSFQFPYHPNTAADGYLVSGDTLVFAYDEAGNQIRVEHTWWAGDQMLEESRTPIGTSDASNSGTVRYVHGPGIDRPLAVLAGSTHIINYTWRGLGESSLTPTGAAGDCSLGGGVGCAAIDWPIDRGVYFTKNYASAGAPTVYKWMGTLTANGGSGTTGLLYRRNRYYDSETGRWTQEDPIGIAGGINVFGFAAGDPVNHRDPFGLTPGHALAGAGWLLKRLVIREVTRQVVRSAARGAVAGAVGGASIAAGMHAARQSSAGTSFAADNTRTTIPDLDEWNVSERRTLIGLILVGGLVLPPETAADAGADSQSGVGGTNIGQTRPATRENRTGGERRRKPEEPDESVP